jgi:HK97 family phage major capsid protein
MTVTVAHDRLDDELRDLRRQRTEQQRETRSLRLEVAHDADGAPTRLAESINREDELANAIRELEAEKQAQLSTMNHLPAGGQETGLDRHRLDEIANSNGSLGNRVAVGEYKSQQELIEFTGRALAAVSPGPVAPPPATLPVRYAPNVVVPPQPPFTLLDQFASVQMDSRTVTFMRRVGTSDSAAVVQPGQLKPESGVQYEAVEASAEVVATWIKVNRIDLNDISGLQSDLQNALGYDIRHEVEALLLAAIIGTTGVLAPDVSADGNTPDKLLTAVGALAALGVQPNFVALNPIDATAAVKEREGTDGAYISGSPWAILPPLVQSAAITPGEALAGDSRIAAQLGVRQGLTIEIGTESDDQIKNRVTVLVEGRWAPMVTVPGAVAHITLGTP